MRVQRLGCLTPLGMLGSFLAIAWMGLSAWLQGGAMFSPGELSARSGPALQGVTSHAELADDCAACHAAPWSGETMTDRCLECHTAVRDELNDEATLHGTLTADPQQVNCRDCHTEHRGAQAALTNILEAGFPHEVVGFSLRAHTTLASSPLACADCHLDGYAQNPLPQCEACHARLDLPFTQAHVTLFGRQCTACHDGSDRYGADFDHDQLLFPLNGRHAALECQSCHAGATTLEALRATPTQCVACHESDDPHAGKFGVKSSCGACHTPDGWEPAELDHNRTDFPLVGQHIGLACESCHRDKMFNQTPNKCAACHAEDDEHAGRFGTDCAACHAPTGWEPPLFDHAKSAFPLTGAHETARCENCHRDRVYKGTPATCVSCHQEDDHHQGSLGQNCALCHATDRWDHLLFDHAKSAFPLSGAHLNTVCSQCHVNAVFKGTPTLCSACHAEPEVHAGLFGTDCAACHTTTAWKPSTFDHNRATRFALTGRHAAVQCADCHTNRRYKGTPTDCAACHAGDDAHKGEFGTGCATCHSTAGWKPASFDHNRNTTFALTGAHVNVNCSTCHVNRVFKGTPKDCVSCHASDDAHKGQMGTNCAACHSTSAWKPSTFNHASTAFQLTGAHVNVNCSACHQNGVFKGTPKDCVSCHASDDAHKGQMGTNCAACHSTLAWKPSTFDHNTAAFQLTGAHVNANCSACHQNGAFKGTPKDCVSCHASDDAHKGQMGTNCAACHSTSAWKPSTFNHASTAFQLTGAHVNVNCSACHQNGAFKGTPKDCVSCHASDDAHGGRFGTNCAACHSTSAWKPASFDHNTSAFPLTGAHVNAACAACHQNGVYKGTPTTCGSCHASDDAHNGQLGTDCAVCHSTSAWRPATFNHANTAFPLTGLHVSVNCSACHANNVYRGTPAACAACHAEPAYHAGVLGTDCAACHSTNGWRPGSYNGPHTFPMDHKDANTCRDCHTSTLADWTCYGCHDQAETVKKHEEKGFGDFSNCMECHPDGRKHDD